jgi:hypothetical protein
MTQRVGRVRAVAGGTAVLIGLSALAACSGGQPKATPTASSTSATTTAPPPSPTASGPAGLVGGPVLAVKIDNTPAARPRIGLDQADVVYVEPVEGGLTRLLVIFSRHLPSQVGPVRSGRESDVALLANYGPVALAFSGSSDYTARILARGKQVNLSFDQSARGYHRDHSRPAPYNVIGTPKELLARAGGSVRPADIGFRYGPAIPGGGSGVAVSTAWPSSRVSLAWSPQRQQYLVTTDGRPETGPTGRQYGATTVVVQYVTTRPSGNRDVNGMPTPVVQLTGTGNATVLRDGHAWNATWSRQGLTAPTSFVAGGQRVTFAPTGPVWVLLVAKGQKVTIR